MAEAAAETQPQDVQIEQALIGCVLRDNALQVQVATIVAAPDFHDALHRRIWERIETLLSQDMVASPLTMFAAMKTDPGLAEVGGQRYLDSLREAAPAFGSVRDFARIIHDLALRRRSLTAINEAADMLHAVDVPVLQALSPLVSIADRTANEMENRAGTAEAGEAAYALIQEIERGEDAGRGAPTGVPRLDELLGGFYPENLIIVAGRPGMGKSAMATTIARSAAQAGLQAEYFSLEMSKRELSARLVCDLDFSRRADAAVPPLHYSRLLKRRVSEKEMARAMDAAHELKALPIFIHDRDGMTMAEIAALARARAAQAAGKPGIIIVDHLHLVRASDRYLGSRVAELTEMTGQAKALAKATKWPVVLLSQLSREIEKRPEKERMPLPSDLRESGSIEQDADVIIGMLRMGHYIRHRKPPEGADEGDFSKWLAEHEPVKNSLDLGVIKNRHGACDTIRCFCDIASNAIRGSDPFNGFTIDPQESFL